MMQAMTMRAALSRATEDKGGTFTVARGADGQPMLTPVTTGVVSAVLPGTWRYATLNAYETVFAAVQDALDAGVPAVGLWLDGDWWHIDPVVTFAGLEEALAYARARNQIAIYDLDNAREVRC